MESQSKPENQLAPAGYAEWYAWAQHEIGGDPKTLQVATNAALDALSSGKDAQAAASQARARTTRSLIEYDLGRVGLDSGDFVIFAVDGREVLRTGMEHVKGVQLAPAPGSGGSLAVFIDGESAWRQFAGCRSYLSADQLLRSISTAYPAVPCNWTTLSAPERRAILDGQLPGLMRQGYRITYQADTTAQLVKEKKVNGGLVVVLLLISIFALFIPILIYLIWYSSTRSSDAIVVSVDEYGRVTQSRTR
jgi:hypothetical protein